MGKCLFSFSFKPDTGNLSKMSLFFQTSFGQLSLSTHIFLLSSSSSGLHRNEADSANIFIIVSNLESNQVLCCGHFECEPVTVIMCEDLPNLSSISVQENQLVEIIVISFNLDASDLFVFWELKRLVQIFGCIPNLV